MTRIRCWEYECVFNSRGTCAADKIEYHPDHGCLTMEEREDYEPEGWEEPFEERWEDEEPGDDDWEDDEF